MGKLILMFTDISNKIEINPDDTIIANFNYQSIPPNQLIVVNPNDLPLANYRDQLEVVKLEFIKYLRNQFQQEAFLSSYNNFYNHIFRSLMKWIHAIQQQILRRKFDKIILSDHVDSSFYLPYYEAEGEINGRLFYEVFDFIPHYICSYFETRGYRFEILNQHKRANLIGRIFFRRYVLLFLKVLLSLRNHIKFLFDQDRTPLIIPETDTLFVFLSRGVPHTHYLLPYLTFNKENTLLFVSDGIKSNDKNLNYFKSLNFNGVSYLKFLRFFDYFRSFGKVLSSLFQTFYLPKVNVEGVDLKLSSSLREMVISYYEAEIYRIALSSFISEIKKKSKANIVLITAEMFTPFTFITAKVGNSFDIKTLQLQTSLIDYWPQTTFTNCDKFIFTSSEALTFYKENNPLESHKYDYWGVLTAVKKDVLKLPLSKVLYFTQPYENQVELDIVNTLKNITQQMGVQLYIKLHPRDPIDKFKSIGEDLLFVEPTKVIDSYIDDFTLAVVRTSAIGKEAIIAAVPTIVCLFSDADQTIKVDFIQDKYKAFKCFVFNREELIQAVQNYDQTVTEFVEFRNSFINDNKLYEDVHSFHQKLTQFSCGN